MLAVWGAGLTWVDAAAAAPVAPGVGTGSIASPNGAASGTGSEESYLGLGCSGHGNCVGVGQYAAGAGYGPMMAVESGGAWNQSTAVELPLDAATGAFQDGFLGGVACPAAGSCVAVGGYQRAGDTHRPMYATSSGVAWGPASAVSLPSNASTGDPFGELNSVACASPGNCGAVGDYLDSSIQGRLVTWTETDGTWDTQAKEMVPPGSGTGGSAELVSVACPAAGDCVAVGAYPSGASASDTQPMAIRETSTGWGQAARVTLPADAAGASGSQTASLAGVSCPSSGNCIATGSYVASDGSRQPMAVAAVDGAWGAAGRAALPADALTGGAQNARLSGVVCDAAVQCDAVGSYHTASGAMGLSANLAPGLALTASAPAGTVGAAYRGQLDASGGTGHYAWSISAGSLPAGLSFDPMTGSISGTPTAAGTSAGSTR